MVFFGNLVKMNMEAIEECTLLGYTAIVEKLKQFNSMDRFDARLVAEVYTQSGVEFYEGFSPVTRFDTIETVLASSSLLDLSVHQLDVKTAFLNSLFYMKSICNSTRAIATRNILTMFLS